ncbi:MAG TPA: 4Fe-4S dicluster domain-containing protein, partial [Phycisphaerales bacterium]|nr:4Fe-4S dicluster domain-containing protein [Phycisphaerales bacterium]
MDESTNVPDMYNGAAVQDVIATGDRARRSTRRGGQARSIAAVVDSRACCGCGACVAACPAGCIEMQYGRRFNWPRVDESRCTKCGCCVQVCPSAFLLGGTAPDFDDDLRRADYPCHLVHSPDDAVRLDAASGGGITGLILHLMETGQADGAVVARCTGANPLAAEAFLATDRTGLLEARGSKYTPVSSGTV